MLLKDNHVFMGMQLDLSPTKHKPEFMHEAHNIRITSSDKEDTYLSLTNEKGTLEIQLSGSIQGYYLGHCAVILYNEELHKNEDVIILFCTNPSDSAYPDSIYKIVLNNDAIKPLSVLYRGNLSFNLEHPIETFFISEAVDINKVYWNDSYNQPRVINLNNVKFSDSNDTLFDFVPTLDLNEIVTIERLLLGGSFSPGVIQYAFSYYNRWGQQSNIFYTSLLLYITFEDRGGSPDELVPNSFKITITNWLEGFDYIRVYSIHRTSIDAVPQCKIVLDIDLREVTGNEIVFIDNGLIGEFTDPAQFPYIGGQSIIALTWTQKDNTLFLGNIKLNKSSISNIHISQYDTLSNCIRVNSGNMLSSSTGISVNGVTPGFKCGEEYRFGFLAQYKDGSWSEPVWIDDFVIPTSNRPYIIQNSNDVSTPMVECVLPNPVLNALKDEEYKNIRALCVFPRTSERNIIAQGIVTPTLITNIESNNNVKNISSWFFRPLVHQDNYKVFPEQTHGYHVRDEFSLYSVDEDFYVDLSVSSFYSPDIEFNDDIQYIDKENLSINIFGLVEFDDILVERSLKTSSVAKLERGGEIKNLNTDMVIAIPQWHDGILGVKLADSSDEVEEHNLIPQSEDTNLPIEVDYLVYPWQASGPLNNDILNGLVPATSVLKTKCLSILLNSLDTFKSVTLNTPNISVIGLKVINNEEEILNIVSNKDKTTFKYQDNLDTSLMGNPYKTFCYNHRNYLNPDSLYFLDEKTPIEDNEVADYAYREGLDVSSLNGKNAFIDVKYKSSKHIVLNTGETLLPTIDNFNIDRDNLFIFNNLILSDIFYLKVPQRGSLEYLELQWDQIIFPASSNELYLRDFQILIANFSVSLYNNVYLSLLYERLLRYNGEPFLMVLDLTRNLITAGGNVYLGGRYLTIVRGFKMISSTSSMQVAQVEIYDVLSKVVVDTTDHTAHDIQLSYIDDNGVRLNKAFRVATMPGDMGQFIRETTVNDAVIDTLKIIGFNIQYDNKLSDSENSTYRPPYTEDSSTLELIPTFEFTYKIYEDGEVVGDLESAFLRNLVSDNLLLEIIPEGTINQIPKLFLCDLYRDPLTINNKFGGTTLEALKSNLWIPASDIYSIDYLIDEHQPILINRGDTWFLKYYCLKTYPYATTDENLIIDKAGFYCETRYNLYGVYDKDKPSTLLFINKDSFNKFNPVYNLSDNFFNYRILDWDFYRRNDFPYSFFWTTEKVNTAEIDAYTNLNLVSSLDVSSIGGEITKLVTHNGSIYCFQPDGVNRILFNSRVLIPVSDGVPIEIANSAKLEGVSNITNTIGCGNKWSVVSTNVGLIFLDDRRKGMFIITDEGIPVNLSSKLNMSNWFSKHKFTPWKRDTSGNWVGTKICDDFVDNDIYLIGNYASLGDSALVYSKKLDLFTSFMSYNEVDSIFNTGDSLYAFKTFSNTPTVKLYKMHGGNYNYFFDKYEPFDFTFISSGDPQNSGPQFDKTFTGVELRALFTGNNYFDYIQSKNDYQDTGVCPIQKNSLAVNRHFSKGDTSKKFRIWRTDIPRVLGDNNRRTLNRVRNIWTKVKLGVNRESAGNWKMELHDINVLYHI